MTQRRRPRRSTPCSAPGAAGLDGPGGPAGSGIVRASASSTPESSARVGARGARRTTYDGLPGVLPALRQRLQGQRRSTQRFPGQGAQHRGGLGRVESRAGILGQHPLEGFPQRVGDRDAWRRRGHVAAPDGVGGAGTCEGCPATEQLVEQDARGVDVGGRAELPVPEELGRHVARGAQQSGRLHRRVVGEARDAEVGQPGLRRVRHVSPGEQHVVGFHVAVQAARPVRRRQGVEDHTGQRHGKIGGHRPVLPQVTAQVATLDEIHHDREPFALDDEVAHPHDVGVRQAQQDRAFLDEAGDDVGVARELRPKHLGGDVPARLAVEGAPHLTHRAHPELLLQLVAASQGLGA